MSTLRHGHEDEVFMATRQGKGREFQWHALGPKERHAFEEKLQEHWAIWLANEAVEVLKLDESIKVLDQMISDGVADSELQLRTVLTDKNEALRTPQNPLPLKANSRLIVDGFRDLDNLSGKLRKDAPTGSRNAQHLLFLYLSLIHI